eukprot:14277087-Alexandrium_andersonii.AAC.1
MPHSHCRATVGYCSTSRVRMPSAPRALQCVFFQQAADACESSEHRVLCVWGARYLVGAPCHCGAA